MSEMHEDRKQFNPGRLQQGMTVVGAVLFIVAFIMMVSGAEEARRAMLQSYLWAWVFWGGLTFGCFAMTLLHHSLKGAWGTSVMRIWEAGGGKAAFSIFAALFVPIVVLAMYSGNSILYAWADPAIRVADRILQ